MTRNRPQLAVAGAGRCGGRLLEVGAEAAQAGAVVPTGGRGGAMAAARGAAERARGPWKRGECER